MNCFDCKIPCEYSNPLGYCYKEQSGLPHGPWEKDYQPSGISKAEQRGLEALPPRWRKSKYRDKMIDSALPVRKSYIKAYQQAEKDIKNRLLELIEEESKFWDDGEMIFRRLKEELNKI